MCPIEVTNHTATATTTTTTASRARTNASKSSQTKRAVVANPNTDTRDERTQRKKITTQRHRKRHKGTQVTRHTADSGNNSRATPARTMVSYAAGDVVLTSYGVGVITACPIVDNETTSAPNKDGTESTVQQKSNKTCFQVRLWRVPHRSIGSSAQSFLDPSAVSNQYATRYSYLCTCVWEGYVFVCVYLTVSWHIQGSGINALLVPVASLFCRPRTLSSIHDRSWSRTLTHAHIPMITFTFTHNVIHIFRPLFLSDPTTNSSSKNCRQHRV